MDSSKRLRDAGVTQRTIKDGRAVGGPMSTLDEYQQSSLEVIQEWWEARRSDPNIEHDASQAELRVSRSRGAGNGPFTYHDTLARLQYFELCKSSALNMLQGRKSLKLAELAELRRQALCLAACERVASTYLTTTPPKSNPLTTQSRPRHGASLVPTIPLNNHNSPFYLWDTQRREVRETTDIIRTDNSYPEYVAISHTWVRWQDHTAEWLQLPGVPWTIPRNNQFDVATLPDILAALPSRYIWIDLLCIPQGKTLETYLLKRQDWEIKCVPRIFRKAFKAVAWLSHLPPWSSLPAVVEYLSAHYLSSSSSSRTGIDVVRLSSLLKTATAAANKPLELLDHDPARTTPSLTTWEPNGLFSSTWSLQELIMRPDMLLCDAKWQFLETRKGASVPVAINDLVALLTYTLLTLGPTPTTAALSLQPLAVQELNQLVERTGLLHLLRLTRTTSVIRYKATAGGIQSVYQEGYARVCEIGGLNPHNEPTEKSVRLSHGCPV